MTTVTNPMTLGQLKRVCAILSDTVPQDEISKIVGNALVNGELKTELEIFWKCLVQKLSPRLFMKIMPSCDLVAAQRIIENVADFKDDELYFSEDYVPEYFEMYAVPFNHPSCIRDIANDINSLGYRLGTPEDLLGLIEAPHRPLPEHDFRLMAIGRKFAGGDNGSIMVLESSSGKLRLLRERINEYGGGIFLRKYNILAVGKRTYGLM